MRLPVWLKEGNSPTTDCDINSTNCVQSEMKKKQKQKLAVTYLFL